MAPPVSSPSVLRDDRSLPPGPFGRVRWLHVELLVLLLLGGSILYQLLVPPVVGLADNGDFARVMGAVGLSYSTPTGRTLDPPLGDGYLNVRYALEPTQWWRRPGYITSEILPVRLSFLPNALVSPPSTFDLRALGVTHALLFLASAWTLLWAIRRLGPAPHLLAAVALLVVGTDVGYVAYFNSLYSDPAGFIALYLFVGMALALCLRPRLRLWVLLGYYGAALVLATARPQYSPLGIVAAGFGAWAQWRLHPRRWVAVGIVLPLALSVASILNFAAQPWNLSMMYRYNNVFSEIAGKSPAPAQDLAELGLDPALARFAGSKAWDPGVPLEDEAWRDDFLRRIGYGQILGFYGRHPDRFLALLERGATQTFVVRMEYLGNFEPSAGLPPRAKSTSFGVWSEARERVLPRAWAFLLGFSVLSVALYVDLWRQVRGSRMLGVPVLLGVLLAMAWGQYLSSLLGEGETDLARHLFLFNAIFDLLLVAGVACVARRVWRWRVAASAARTARAPALVPGTQT